MIALAIFISSSIEGAASAIGSMAIVDWIRQLFDIDIGRHTLNIYVRNLAHFLVFFLLGFCLTCAMKYVFKHKRLVFWISWGIATAYGVLDEIHQYFVPGRIFLISDMVINAIGAFFGVTLAYLLFVRKSKKGRG